VTQTARAGDLARRALPALAAAAIAVDVLLTFLVAPDAAIFRGPLTQRIFYYHVPAAWCAYLAFGITAVASLVHLRTRDAGSDAIAVASVEVGVLFALMALVTGVVWSTQEFSGSYSAARDPPVRSLAGVVLSYFAYIALRAAIDERENRRRLAAVFGLLAFLGVPLSYLAIKASVHPDFTREDQTLAPELGLVLAYSTLAFTLLFAALVDARVRLARSEDAITDMEET
jgi:heme exporter protein C